MHERYFYEAVAGPRQSFTRLDRKAESEGRAIRTLHSMTRRPPPETFQEFIRRRRAAELGAARLVARVFDVPEALRASLAQDQARALRGR